MVKYSQQLIKLHNERCINSRNTEQIVCREMHDVYCIITLLVGMGNISILSYIVILRAHDNRIVVVLQLLSYRLHIISGAFT